MLVTPMAVVALGFAFMSASGMEGRPDGTDAKGGADKSLKTVKTWLKGLCKGEPQGLSKIEAVDAAVRRLFPDEQFYSVRFMRYPRAVKPPAPLKLENLVGVHADGSVERIDSLDALKTLLEKKLADVRTEDQARSALLASLRLAQEFYQDGNYTFTVPEQSISVVSRDNHWIASGKSVVTKGGEGEITVSLTTGTPGQVTIKGKVKPDVRLR